MDNSKYLININWVPKQMNGYQDISSGGVTYSVPSYTEGYYVASMPEVKIAATASTRGDALNNLITLSLSTDSPGNPPLSTFRTY